MQVKLSKPTDRPHTSYESLNLTVQVKVINVNRQAIYKHEVGAGRDELLRLGYCAAQAAVHLISARERQHEAYFGHGAEKGKRKACFGHNADKGNIKHVSDTVQRKANAKHVIDTVQERQTQSMF